MLKFHIKELIIGKILGAGAFGSVNKVKLKGADTSSLEYVFKRIDDHESLVNERTIWSVLSALNIPNIVTCFGVVEEKGTEIGFLFSLAKGKKYSTSNPLPRKDIPEFARQSIRCLIKLHKAKISHNDVASRNFFWDETDKEFTLFDFGCAFLKTVQHNYDGNFDNHYHTDELPVKCGTHIKHPLLKDYYAFAATKLAAIFPNANETEKDNLLRQYIAVHPAPFRYHCMNDYFNLLLTIEKFDKRFFPKLGIDIHQQQHHTESGMNKILHLISKF